LLGKRAAGFKAKELLADQSSKKAKELLADQSSKVPL